MTKKISNLLGSEEEELLQQAEISGIQSYAYETHDGHVYINNNPSLQENQQTWDQKSYTPSIAGCAICTSSN